MASQLDRTRTTEEKADEINTVGQDRMLLGTRVVTADGGAETNIMSTKLLELLRGLKYGEFVIVHVPGTRGEDHYVQAYHESARTWHLEYRDGGPDRHYGADCHSTSVVYEILASWADDSPDWRERLPWQRMELL